MLTSSAGVAALLVALVWAPAWWGGESTALDGRAAAGPGEARAALPTPRRFERGGVTYTAQRSSPRAVTVDPRDPSVIEVHVSALDGAGPECNVLRPSARLVEESATAVRVATFDYQVPHPDDEPRSCARLEVVEMTGDEADEPSTSQEGSALRVRLAEPLAGRRVIDDRSGDTVGTLPPGAAPTASYLPEGFEQTLLVGWSPENDFAALRQFDRDGSGVEVLVRSVTAWARFGRVVRRDEVAGHRATVTDQDDQRCVSWSPRDGLVAEVCSLGEQGGDLTPDQLLRIARGVTVPGAD